MIPNELAKPNAGNFIEVESLPINGNGQALILRMHYLEEVEIEDGDLMIASLLNSISILGKDIKKQPRNNR
ncbi:MULTISPECIES: hypothetical protein [unclassified Endozoicomonas]|uniref:hypothetical protein n=1 Tax=unclassified Endozoicomonas TaxID=2644528 RepID=UPI003BB499EF